jgi:hypothetical protein
VVVLVLCVGVALADEIRAVITKVEGRNVTFSEVKGKNDRGPEKTLPVSKSAKVVKGKFNKETKKVEAGDEIEGGIKGKLFSNINPEKGIRATIVTNDDNTKITEIRIMKGGKKKRDQ